ncbi:hypothetical protein ACXGQW_11560 [Wenyingzhuangia sp. IMCC45533]
MKKAVFAIPLLFIIFGFSLMNNKTKEDKFWNWFSKNHKKIYLGIENDDEKEKIYDAISSKLKRIEPDLTFELSPKLNDNTRELTISAEGDIKHFSTVRNLVKKAPKLKNWKFNALKQRANNKRFKAEYDKFKREYGDIYFRYKDGKYGEIGLELNIRNYNGKVATQEATFHLIDILISEYDHTHAIEWVDWVVLKEQEVEYLEPFINLRRVIDAKKLKKKPKHHNFVL